MAAITPTKRHSQLIALAANFHRRERQHSVSKSGYAFDYSISYSVLDAQELYFPRLKKRNEQMRGKHFERKFSSGLQCAVRIGAFRAFEKNELDNEAILYE